MKRPILYHPDARLKKTCAPVVDITDSIRQLTNDMLETMYAAPGVGLAAPQIGVLSRLIVMDCKKNEVTEAKPFVMLNPEVTASSDQTNIYEEGCLSIPEHFAEVTRPKEVEVSWLDINGDFQKQGFDGLTATCVQHEIDHLNGKLFIDYIGVIKRQVITRKMQKFKRDLVRKKDVI